MELLPVELRKTLPPLYSQESCATPIVHVKLFTLDSSFTWYVTEGAEQEDGDWLLFGFVIGLEEEWGVFSAERVRKCARAFRPGGRTGSVVPAGADR